MSVNIQMQLMDGYIYMVLNWEYKRVPHEVGWNILLYEFHQNVL